MLGQAKWGYIMIVNRGFLKSYFSRRNDVSIQYEVNKGIMNMLWMNNILMLKIETNSQQIHTLS